MSEERHERRDGKQALAVLATMPLVFLPLYVLSIGPVVWLATNGYIDDGWQATISVIYAPLEYAYERVHAVKVFFDFYLALFGHE